MSNEFLNGMHELVAAAMRGVLSMRTGTVESYGGGRVDVKIEQYDGDEAPIIKSIPIIFPSSGGVTVKLPVSIGDGVCVVFAGRDIRSWLAGRESTVKATHRMTDAVAIPGLFTDAKVPQSYSDNSNILISYRGGSVSIDPVTGIVKNGVGGLSLIQSPSFKAALDAQAALFTGPTPVVASQLAGVLTALSAAITPTQKLLSE